MNTHYRRFHPLLLVAALLLAGCAAPGPATGTAGFSNFLVIGVAGSWDSRAQFERTVVSELRESGVAAQSYNNVVGGGRRPTREEVLAAVDEHGFDAVVVTRVLDTEADIQLRSTITGAKVNRKETGFMKLFRYDYEELGDPLNLQVDVQVDFATEVYAVGTEDMTWSSETRGPRAENVAVLVDETAKSVVRQLKRAGLLAR